MISFDDDQQIDIPSNEYIQNTFPSLEELTVERLPKEFLYYFPNLKKFY